MQLIAQCKGFADAVAERCVIRARQHTVSGQAIWWLCHASASLVDTVPAGGIKPGREPASARANRWDSPMQQHPCEANATHTRR